MDRKALLVAVFAFAAALAAPGTASAVCSLSGVTAKTPNVYRVNAPPFEYRVEGVAYVSNPSAKKGCVMQVCEAEELGKGNWVNAWCTWNAIGPKEKYYFSYAPYVDCQNYGGTGYFRSSVRMEGSNVRILGPPRYVCT